MAKPSARVPKYCHHKASGQAVVRLDGRDHYLGEFGSPESHERYQRRVAEWIAAKTNGAIRSVRPHDELTINELVLGWDEHAAAYYAKDGKPTNEYKEYRSALRPVCDLYGSTRADEFGPLALKAVQGRMVEFGWSRGVVNHRINRVRTVFKWAVSQEFVLPSVYEALRTVAPLKFGRTEARESEPVKPVPRSYVEATLPFVSTEVAAMIWLQLLSGMRPCEVVLMRACDIDMTGDIWVYEPHDHKNRWRGQQRLVPLGPQAQAIIRPFLKLETEAYLFSPAAAEDRRHESRRASRKTPMTPSQSRRRRKAKPTRAKREHYDASSYRRAIKYGIQQANKNRRPDDQIPNWFPLQLRHTRATEIRRDFGIEAAQVVLGHARADVTQVYAERNLAAAIEVARKSG